MNKPPSYYKFSHEARKMHDQNTVAQVRRQNRLLRVIATAACGALLLVCAVGAHKVTTSGTIIHQIVAGNTRHDVLTTRSDRDVPMPDMKIQLDLSAPTPVQIYFESGNMTIPDFFSALISLYVDDEVVKSQPVNVLSGPDGVTLLWMGTVPAGTHNVNVRWRVFNESDVLNEQATVGVVDGLPRRLVVTEFTGK